MALFGTKVLRVEDPQLLRGESTFVANVDLPGLLHVGYVSSTLAHGRIVSLDVEEGSIQLVERVLEAFAEGEGAGAVLREGTRAGDFAVEGPPGDSQFAAAECDIAAAVELGDLLVSNVQDSLARGVSYFMAELERLKQIVDAAHEVQVRGTATQLFLLDEILHGTNTAERRIAATRVVRHLVDAGAIGAATTHDLELAEEPALANAARLVHFSETFEDVDGESMLRFDYRLREGLATSTNALALMRIVGLPDA